MPTRPIRIIKIEKAQPRFVLHKSHFFGNYNTAVVVLSRKPKKRQSRVQCVHPTTLKKLYDGPLRIKATKLKDLLHLVQFLVNPDAKDFYQSLKSDNIPSDNESDVEFGDDPPIDEDI